MKSHLIYLFLGAQQINSDPATPPSLKYFESTTTTPEGATYVLHLDKARRMFSPDSELQSISGTYDASTSALTEGADWAGNFWTQNSYGFGFAAASFLPNAVTSWLQTSYLWWYNNAGDGSQRYGGLNDVPAGMLCDNGSPNLCNFMQCAAGREAILRKQRFEGEHFSDHNNLHDTAALGHDFIIEGTLAGTIMQAEMLLATRNVTGAKNFFLPIMRQTSDFLEVSERAPYEIAILKFLRCGITFDLCRGRPPKPPFSAALVFPLRSADRHISLATLGSQWTFLRSLRSLAALHPLLNQPTQFVFTPSSLGSDSARAGFICSYAWGRRFVFCWRRCESTRSCVRRPGLTCR